MKWTVGEAKQRFSEVLRKASREPQVIHRRDEPVAVILDFESYQDYIRFRDRERRRTVGAAFAELRQICAEEGYVFDPGPRKDRPNPFADALDDVPG